MRDEVTIELQDLLYEHMNSKDKQPETYKALEVFIDKTFKEKKNWIMAIKNTITFETKFGKRKKKRKKKK